MSFRIGLFMLMLLAQGLAFGADSPATLDTCRDCHATLEPPLNRGVIETGKDVHTLADLSCADCHGGDPTKTDKQASKDPGTGYRGVPLPKEIPEFCSRCHSDPSYMRNFNPSLPTDQLEKYKTSHHGERLREGITTVATCVSCHGSHNILAADQPLSTVYPTQIPKTCAACHSDPEHMKGTGLPTDQFEKYTQSVHGKALFERHDITGAPTCNDCHGNHAATPPGVTAVGNVCGTCHIRNREIFARSVHKEIFDALDMPECSTCHDHHLILPPSDAMLDASEGSVCSGCHDTNDEPMRIAKTIRTEIEGLEKMEVEAVDALDKV
ncbi:MAG: cytochrome c3 family protein, partial [bacterium]